MTPDERDAMYIATCKTCLLGDAMKHCRLCKFAVGLIARLDEVLNVDELTAAAYGNLDLTAQESFSDYFQNTYPVECATRAQKWQAWKAKYPHASPYRFGTSMWDKQETNR